MRKRNVSKIYTSSFQPSDLELGSDRRSLDILFSFADLPLPVLTTRLASMSVHAIAVLPVHAEAHSKALIVTFHLSSKWGLIDLISECLQVCTVYSLTIQFVAS